MSNASPTPFTPKSASSRNCFSIRAGQLLVIIGVFSIILIGPMQPYIAAMRTQEGVYIPENSYQFSSQEVDANDETLSHNFVLYNGRPKPLHVQASADCGCTGLSWQNAIVPPFGSKPITASMAVYKRSASVGITFKLDQGKYIFASLQQRN